MATQKKQTDNDKVLHTIVEPYLSLVVNKANELHVTKDEFTYLGQTTNGFVLIYYR